MGRDRFATADSLYRAALALPAERRSQFLEIACEGDDALRLAVEALLAKEPSHDDITVLVRPQHTEMRRFRTSQIIGGRFEVIRLLGSGGMGDVYEAKDLQLGEHVALKTIRPEFASEPRMVSRFKQEILVAKRVTNPHVCRIYDVGFHSAEPGSDVPVLFLTMELLRGESLSSRLLSGRMTTDEALPLVEQMAQGLTAAHDSGVVHRDFKPGNVMVVPAAAQSDVRVVITDFGLAQSVAGNSGSDLTVTLTASGEIAGTPAYMAPEQVIGARITFAADIYALGIVVYQMVTAKLPFEEGPLTPGAGRGLSDPPVPPRTHAPDLDPRWERAILRCLERDPKDRFPSAADFARALTGSKPLPPDGAALWSRRKLMLFGGVGSFATMAGIAVLLGVFRTAPSSSIAVLPIVNEDPELDYASEGMTEDLINLFGQTRGLRVMSRAAVFRLKETELSPQELGRKLNVHYLLTGRLLKKNNTVSIAIELTDARDGAHVWGAQYERPVTSLLDVQQEVARSILQKLNLPLEGPTGGRFAARRTASGEVNELYWRARFFWNKRTQEGLQKATQYFREAVDKDPSFAPAYAGLADCYSMRSGAIPPRQTFPNAKSAAMTAIQLDDSLAEGHASLAFILLFFDWDWARAEAEYLRAIELNPNYPTAHSMYGMYLVAMKRFDEAMRQMKLALELDPSSLAIHTGVGRVLLYERRYGDASAQYSKTLEMDPKFAQALFDYGITRTEQGKYDEALALLKRGLDSAGEDASALAQIAYVQRLAGRPQLAAQALASLQDLSARRYVSPYFLALAYIGSDENRALALLEQAYEDRSYSMIYLNVDARLDRLRRSPRFRALLERLRFSAA